jgi:hypothetical protein
MCQFRLVYFREISTIERLASALICKRSAFNFKRLPPALPQDAERIANGFAGVLILADLMRLR